jgi:hypothetical protein
LKTRSLMLAAVLLTACAAFANELLTFDDINATGFPVAAIPDGYQGFNWTNFGVVNAPAFVPVSGFDAGLISPPNVAFNGVGAPANFSSATAFALTSGYFTGAWNDGLNIMIEGFNGATLEDSTTIVVSSTAPTLETFNWTNLTEVTFDAFGGTKNVNYVGSGTEFALDNLDLNGITSSVPEPSTIVLLTAGLAACVGLRVRRTALSTNHLP